MPISGRSKDILILFLAFCCVAASIGVLAILCVDWSGDRGWVLVWIVYIVLNSPIISLLLTVLAVAIVWLLLWCLRRGGRHQTKQHDLETRTIELTDEHRRIMERFGVTYEDGKFHYEGKAYDSLSDVPLK